MGYSKTYNYQGQIQYYKNPEGVTEIIGINTLRKANDFKNRPDVKHLFLWPQTASARKTLRGFAYVEMKKGYTNKGFTGFE